MHRGLVQVLLVARQAAHMAWLLVAQQHLFKSMKTSNFFVSLSLLTYSILHKPFRFPCNAKPAFSALTLLAACQEEHLGNKDKSDEVLVWFPVWSEVQIVCIWSSWCHSHPKTPRFLASFKSRLVLPFWYQLTQIVLKKRPLNGCFSLLMWIAK